MARRGRRSLGRQRTAGTRARLRSDLAKGLAESTGSSAASRASPLDSDDNVWLYNRPNDLTNIELHAELDPPLALCCVRAPSMIHLDRAGRVIGSFDAPQGHGMDVDSEGFVYLGQDTVRKYDPRTGEVVAEIARAPEREDGGPVGLQPARPQTRARRPWARRGVFAAAAARSRGRRGAGGASRGVSREVSACRRR